MTGNGAAEIVEVGPRDGLQNEPGWVDIDSKVMLVDALSECGFKRIEVGSFVNPARVPQMAGSAEVFRKIRRAAGITYSALVPNLRGLEDAVAAQVDEIAVFASATEGFSQANLGWSIAESLRTIRRVAGEAAELGLPVRGYVSCVLECPFDGPTDPDKVLHVAERLLDFGCRQVSLGDTIGRGHPDDVRRLMDCMLREVSPGLLAGHFHDTAGRAVANIEAALDCGVAVFDASIGGLGGCPFAPGSAGNVATEKVCDMLEASGCATGLDRMALARAAGLVGQLQSATDGNRQGSG